MHAIIYAVIVHKYTSLENMLGFYQKEFYSFICNIF